MMTERGSRLERRIRRCFDRSAPEHHRYAQAQAHTGQALIEHLCRRARIDPDALVLEIGCGRSVLARRLGQRTRFGSYLGLDLAGELLRKAQTEHRPLRRGNTNQEQNIAWIQADTHHLPLASNSVDLLISSMVLHWCTNILQALQDIERVLNEGAWAAIAIPVYPSIAGLKRRISDLGGGQALHQFWRARQWQELFPLHTVDFTVIEHTIECANTQDAIACIRGVGANCLWRQSAPGQTPIPVPVNAQALAKWRWMRQQPDWNKPLSLRWRVGLWLLQKQK